MINPGSSMSPYVWQGSFFAIDIRVLRNTPCAGVCLGGRLAPGKLRRCPPFCRPLIAFASARCCARGLCPFLQLVSFHRTRLLVISFCPGSFEVEDLRTSGPVSSCNEPLPAASRCAVVALCFCASPSLQISPVTGVWEFPGVFQGESESRGRLCLASWVRGCLVVSNVRNKKTDRV